MIGKAAGIKCDVIVNKEVTDKINELVHLNPKLETGAFLIGNASFDAVSGKPTVYVKDVYFEERAGAAATFEFTPEYKMNAVLHVKKKYPGREYHIIGNIHSHASFHAFWSPTDYEMMRQTRDNSVYMVVSPSHGNWECIFKDSSFNFYECDLKLAGGDIGESMFAEKNVTRQEVPPFRTGKPFEAADWCVRRSYSPAQRKALDERFNFSIEELKGRRVLLVGAGNIGNLIGQYLSNAGVSDLTIVDMDVCEHHNLPRSCMFTHDSIGKRKSLELAHQIAERAHFPMTVRGINADVYELGFGFFKDFDLVISPVDSAAVRQFIDRGCRLYKVPHITCGTGLIGDDFTGNVLFIPAESVVDLEYIWGNGYRLKLEEHLGCAELPKEVQAQVMSFSAQIAGMTVDLALKLLRGKIPDKSCAYKYVLNSVGKGYDLDGHALRTYKYGKRPAGIESEFYDVFDPEKKIPSIKFNRAHPKRELWKVLNRTLGGGRDTVYKLDLEWSLNVPVAYLGNPAIPMISVDRNTGVDSTLGRLPDRHIYLVQVGDEDRLVEINFYGECEDK